MQLTKEMKRVSAQTVEDVIQSGVKTFSRYGTIVVDATEPIELVVTRDHVRKGNPGEPNACAIARALTAEGVKSITGVAVGVNFAYVGFTNGIALRYKLPADAQAMTRAFDGGREVYLPPAGMPVQLEAPSPVYKIGARTGENRGSEVRKGRVYPAIRAIARRQVTSLAY